MTGYVVEGWTDLFLCAGGAAAALCGLIFVGLSVNLEAILRMEPQTGQASMTGRALEAFAALLIVLVISIVGLTPALNPNVLAAFVITNGVVNAIFPCRALRLGRGRGEPTAAMLLRLFIGAGLTFTLLAFGTTLALGQGGGLYWVPAAFVLAFSVAAVHAWVILVEIVR
ncbi:hypothetical protein [Streptomyces sp. NPDC051014]|uniref:hypothetical protein n=1 Tax=Streptomyces sp. NPDC051014 TaxID=3155751 RepID=UPI0033CEF310